IAECLRIAGVPADAVTDVAIGGRMNFLYEAGTESTSAMYRLVDMMSRTGMLRLLLGNRPSAYLLRAIFGTPLNPMFNRHGELTSGLAALGVTAPIRYFDHHLCHNASAFY